MSGRLSDVESIDSVEIFTVDDDPPHRPPSLGLHRNQRTLPAPPYATVRRSTAETPPEDLQTPHDRVAAVRFASRLAKFVREDLYMMGTKYVADESVYTLRRVVWALLVVGAASFAVYQIANRLEHYFAYPSNTAVSLVHTGQLPFPQVTVCNMNRFLKSSYLKC